MRLKRWVRGEADGVRGGYARYASRQRDVRDPSKHCRHFLSRRPPLVLTLVLRKM